MSAHIIPAADAREAIRVGGKAAALSALVRAGHNVPPFFVIAAEAFAESGLCETLRVTLARELANLGDGPFAVRSSARDEDGKAHSHAGQFLSLLDVARSDVENAAVKVWRSGEARAVEAYRVSRGLDANGSAPSVIVQQLVRARAAGVAFSADPVSGRRDRIVVSAIEGLGDRLVGGEADGDNYVIDGASGAVLIAPDCGVLTPSDLTALTALVRQVEQDCGTPQDIEWAFEADRLFLLQARPITTPLRALPISDDAPAIFDNSNIVESYPGLVSPLTYSFAQYVYARVYRTFVALLGVSASDAAAHGAVFENMLARVDGRVYYNLINWYRALALLPGFALNRAYMETMMGVGKPLPAAIAEGIGPKAVSGAARLREYMRIARVAFGLLRQAIRLNRTMRDFYVRLDRALSHDLAAIDGMPLTALAEAYRRVEAELLERWDAPLINDFLCMMTFGASRKLIETWAGAQGLALHNDVMIGQGDIVSAEPAQRIARMGALAKTNPAIVAALAAGDCNALASAPALAREVEAYVEKFGDRCAEELKLESITLHEDVRPLLFAIAAAANNPRSGAHAHRGDRGEPSRIQLNKLFTGRPVKRFLARRALAQAKARVRDRENLRFERTRVFGFARRIFIAIGRQFHSLGVLDDPRDVFFLTVPEVLGAIEGFGVSTDLKAMATLRKAELAAAAARPDPPERITISGAAVLQTFSYTPSVAHPADDAARQGTGCCAGVVQGRARAIRDPRTDSLERGEILVARHTDPGWIALFANAAALVVERGSLLSHSAIVARELGIPCVVGLKGAMDWIATGEIIEVDGGAGIVRKRP